MATIHSLKKGATIPEGVTSIAEKLRVRTAGVKAIGGVDRLVLAFYNHTTKKYEEHSFEGFYEVTSMLGNITIKDGKPFLHAHGTFGGRDMKVVGGHIISARVFPLLEVVLSPTTNRAMRKFDKETGLNMIQGG